MGGWILGGVQKERMNEWKGVLVFNKEMVRTCLAINACM